MAARLTAEFGRGFTDKNLRHMIRFAEAFPDREIVYALSRQLGWTHFRRLIYLDDPLKRDFYAEICRVERWNTRTLEKRPASSAEIQYWVNRLPSLGYYGVASSFVTGTEFRTDAVQTFYGVQAQASRPYFPDLLNRGASQAEINYWVNSGLDFLSIEIAIASSAESYNKASNG
jgi:hypothetical protein